MRQDRTSILRVVMGCWMGYAHSKKSGQSPAEVTSMIMIMPRRDQQSPLFSQDVRKVFGGGERTRRGVEKGMRIKKNQNARKKNRMAAIQKGKKTN